MKTGRLQTNGDAVAAAGALLSGMIEKGVVDEVLVPALQSGGTTALALFADSTMMDKVNPWAPVMGVQGARAVSKLAFTDPGVKTAVVLRPCETRAAVELIKLKQIKNDNLIFINVDCPGTCELNAFKESGKDALETSKALIDGMKDGKSAAPDGAPFRLACTVCENPAAEWGDITLQLFGGSGEMGILADDEIAEALESAELASFGGEGISGREAVVERLVADRTAARDALFAKFEEETGSLDGFKDTFSTCIRCLNCMENCPICYCKVCIFKSPTFDHEGELYAKWAKRKGAQKMPSETTLFHMTRLNHMSTSCIGCGLCDTVCPMGLPVATLFRKVASGVQTMLEYVPGKSLDDEIPLSVFREDELQEQAGAKD